MTGDKSLNVLEEARKHRRKAAEMRTLARAQTDPDLREMYEELARSHEAQAAESEGLLNPGQTKS